MVRLSTNTSGQRYALSLTTQNATVVLGTIRTPEILQISCSSALCVTSQKQSFFLARECQKLKTQLLEINQFYLK
ncbi:hypothetical protein FLP30_07815 [Acetobacter vaccinii]|uniref:Uncharacterized protein n=1 Tax=Acetobacter vaccinii TaxID=2592655 RepID=A0A5C1YS87_9PROT|nr:hypothetical protein FLP30_07815 [Acetobacter vaccinii]